jgi:hypothetical protein
LDGYVITRTADEAFAAYGKEGVRHVAELDTGEGIVCFTGEIPCEGTVLENQKVNMFWFGPKIRWVAPTTDHDPETFGLYTSEAFQALFPGVVQMASLVEHDMILAMTTGPQPGARWQASATRYLDIRVPQLVPA